MNTGAKFLNKVLVNKFQHYIESLTYQNHLQFFSGIQGWFDIWNSITVIDINRIKDMAITIVV